MNYRESQAWMLTSPTTVYSGARRALRPHGASASVDSFRARLATEFHTLGLSIHKEGSASEAEPMAGGSVEGSYQSRPAFRSESYYTVGYDAIGDWEVLVMLHRASVHEGRGSQKHAEQRANGNLTKGAVKASITAKHVDVATTHAEKGTSSVAVDSVGAHQAASTSDTKGSGIKDDPSTLADIDRHRRTPSAASNSSMTHLGDVFTTLHHSHGGSHLAQPTQQSSFSNVTGMDDTHTLAIPATVSDSNAPAKQSSQPPLAMVVLRNLATQDEFCASMPTTRPLAPTLAILPATRESHRHDYMDMPLDDSDTPHEQVVLWLGNADSNVLQLWYPSDATLRHNRGKMVCYSDDSSSSSALAAALRMEMPILAVDFLQLDPEANKDLPTDAVDSDSSITVNGCCLAMASQDGSIRTVTFDAWNVSPTNEPQQGSSLVQSLPIRFDNVRQHTITVDGPTVSLHLQERKAEGLVELVAGSLCGYVFAMTMTTKAMSNPLEKANSDTDSEFEYGCHSQHLSLWSDPVVIAEDFYCPQLGSEDSILAVHAHGNLVFVGTYAGMCCVYEITTEGAVDGAVASELLWQCRLPYSVHCILAIDKQTFLVTTRRSVHCFTGNRVRYDPALALLRLRMLLEEHKVPFPPVLEVMVHQPLPEALHDDQEDDGKAEQVSNISEL